MRDHVRWASAFPVIRVGVDGLGLAALSFLRLAVDAVALLVIAPLTGVRLPRGRLDTESTGLPYR